MRDTPYKVKEQCSGCGACVDICSQNAICMVPDKYGFEYPRIDLKKCVGCGLCQDCCSEKEPEQQMPINQFAAINRNTKQKAISSSGGIFPAVAEIFIERGWHIFGATLSQQDLTVKHIEVTSLSDLEKIQGSKYVKSDLTGIFKQIRELLNLGEKVVFVGTPCQVSALRKFVKREYETLLLIDLVCHGAPAPVWWKEYLKQLGRQYNTTVKDVKFRDNTQPDKAHYGKIEFLNGAEIPFSRKNSSFYDLFLNSSIVRESCFNCQFSSVHRPGDVTLGDFWNFSKVYDVDSLSKIDKVDLHHGISCVLVNTIKGMRMLNGISADVWFKEVKLCSIVDNNEQLQHPTSIGKNRKAVLFLYKNFGYSAVNKYWKIKFIIKKLMGR